MPTRPNRGRSLFARLLATVLVIQRTAIPTASAETICPIDRNSIVEDACVSYSTLDSLSQSIAPLVTDLTRNTDFFSYYRLNLFNKECPFWSDENAMCGNRACAVITLDSEDDIPAVWRAEELSKLEGPKAAHPPKQAQKERPQRPLEGKLGEHVGESCVVEYDDECSDRDYCVREDEDGSFNGDYVSLVDNPERFTGYGGQGAHHVWDAIYRENCFVKEPSSQKVGAFSPAKSFLKMLSKSDLQRAVALVPQNKAPSFDDTCLEKRVFYRLVSGMHASISTHLCWEYFDQKAGTWMPNVACYKTRLHDHPDRISNLYFNFALVSQAISKLHNYMQQYSFCSGDPEQNLGTQQKVLQLTDAITERPRIFDESVMFRDELANGLKKEFRHRFRNVSRLMDCIGCDKCRLWGKLQTAGYGTALKVLFEFDEGSSDSRKRNPQLRQTEIVALFNTFARLIQSVGAVQKFERAIETDSAEGLPQHITVELNQPRLIELEQESSKKSRSHAQTAAATGPPGFLKKHDEIGTDADHDSDEDYEREWDEEEEEEEEAEGAEEGEDVYDRTKAGETEPPLMEVLKQELRVVKNAFAVVLGGWIQLPGMISNIVRIESTRLYNYYIGLPIPPRQWRFGLQPRNEL